MTENSEQDPSAAIQANRTLWDQWTGLHETSRFYDVDGFRQGATSLQSIELDELGPHIEGKDLLHLQCHFGLDTLSWARLGAQVTGVDLSPEATRLGTRLAAELDIPARFIASDVLRLDDALDDTYDVVFASYGVLDWLPDLERWAEIIDGFLRPGGVFYMVEFHPLATILGDDGKTLKYPYFPHREPIRLVEQGSYAAPDADVEGELFVWSHSLSEIFMALLGRGLQLEHFHEFDWSPYDCFPFTQEESPGRSVVPGMEGKIPLTFSLQCRKPS